MFAEKIEKAIRNPLLVFRWAYFRANRLFKIFNLKLQLLFCPAMVTIGKKLILVQKIKFSGKGKISIGDQCSFGVRNGGVLEYLL